MTIARRKSRVRDNRDGDASFVTVVGGANIDIHGRSTRALQAHDSNPGTVHISAGGVARNIAENLVRLGVDCRLITAVGDDHNGRTLMQLANEARIDTRFVQQIASAQTSTYLSINIVLDANLPDSTLAWLAREFAEQTLFVDTVSTAKAPRINRVIRNAGGAGDAFLAGLAYSWLEHHDLENTLRVALTAAELTLSDTATSSPALSLTAINQALEARDVS